MTAPIEPTHDVEPRDAEMPGGQALEGQALELTILMPCLNEAETIEVCVRKARGFLERAGVKGEVLIADNGSTDGSQAMAQAEGARVVAVPEKGYGAALMGGIVAAHGRYVVMGDADDSYDFENLDGMLEHLRGGADLVMGNRFKGGISPGAMPFLHRYLGNPVLSFLGRLFFHVPTGDFHCGLRGFSRAAILGLDLKSPGMEFASEMVVKAQLAKLRIEETPTTLRPDGRSRAPHLKTWRDGWRHLRFLLLHSPKWLFVYPGAVLIALGLAGAIILSAGAVRLTPGLELDIHTLTASCFAILIGVQLVMFGSLARRYAMVEGILPPATRLHSFLMGLSLEVILRIAGVIFALGVIGAIWAVSLWAQTGFGEIQYHDVMRVLVISLTAVAVSVQLAASGFLASVFTLRR
ncbi:MAG TPA: glycosyltransferase family 2 protein [Caulobacteraceae bacterium]|nr:glycosyltransferase family 2 protein [Caulobacteraceae bacterium]